MKPNHFIVLVTLVAVAATVATAYMVGYSAGEQEARQRYETRIDLSW